MKSSLYLGPMRRKPGLREKLFDDAAPGCFSGCTALSEQSAVIMMCIVCSMSMGGLQREVWRSQLLG
jgi:hypothetical protein